MSAPRRTPLNSSGQALLITIAIIAVLTIGLAAVFFTSQTGTFHQNANTQRTKSQSAAEEGLADATQELSATLTRWQSALAGDFSGTDCNTHNVVKSPSGEHFTLYCSTGTTGNPNLQTYEVAVTAVASIPNGNGIEMSLRAMKAYLGQRTLGADSNAGIHAPAALQLARPPDVSGTLDVEWGPIACLEFSSTWSLPNALDSGRYPRKFSVGGITGGAYLRSAAGSNSDHKEYWAYTSQTDVPLIDETYYIQHAQLATGITPPKYADGVSLSPIGCLPAGNTTCGYFEVDPLRLTGIIAIFDGPVIGYTVAIPDVNISVIYVKGSAQFNKVAINGATFITTGALYLKGDAANAIGGTLRTLNVPISADLEYPYYPTTPTSWPCQSLQGGTCVSAGNIQFRGFLYVKGYLKVNQPGWAMAGAILVGDPSAPLGTAGQLEIPNNDSLTLYYDDGINHSLHVNPIFGTSLKVVPDHVQDVTAF